jgi:hypothetical protein
VRASKALGNCKGAPAHGRKRKVSLPRRRSGRTDFREEANDDEKKRSFLYELNMESFWCPYKVYGATPHRLDFPFGRPPSKAAAPFDIHAPNRNRVPVPLLPMTRSRGAPTLCARRYQTGAQGPIPHRALFLRRSKAGIHSVVIPAPEPESTRKYRVWIPSVSFASLTGTCGAARE